MKWNCQLIRTISNNFSFNLVCVDKLWYPIIDSIRDVNLSVSIMASIDFDVSFSSNMLTVFREQMFDESRSVYYRESLFLALSFDLLRFVCRSCVAIVFIVSRLVPDDVILNFRVRRKRANEEERERETQRTRTDHDYQVLLYILHRHITNECRKS